MQYTSSYYKNAEKINVDGYELVKPIDRKGALKIYPTYCYSASNPTALTNSFKQLAQEIIIKQIISEKMDESTVLKDYITPYFELDTSKRQRYIHIIIRVRTLPATLCLHQRVQSMPKLK